MSAMSSRSNVAVAFAVVALAASMSARQQTTQPPRTVPPVIGPVGPAVPGVVTQNPAQTGLATRSPLTAIVGQVVDTAGRPIPKAAVRLITDRVLETVLTDPRGRFAFTQIPSGEMVVTAEKHGYFDGGYGQRRATGLPLPFQLPYGQTMPNMKIEVFRGAIVTGFVHDETGEPIVGAHVFALRRQFKLGEWQYTAVDGEDTDDLGMFRMFNLLPGEYLVSVGASPLAMNQQGDMQVEDREKPSMFPRMYYPQAPERVIALPLSLAAGDVRYGVDFRLPPVITRQVTGQLMGPPAAIAQQVVKLMPIDAAWATDAVGSTISKDDGTFVFDLVPEGRYRIQAGQIEPKTWSASNGTTLADSIDADRPYCGNAEITVRGSDVVTPGIEMVLSAALAFQVHLEHINGGQTVPQPRSIPVIVEPAGPGLSHGTQLSVAAGVPFAVSHLIPGPYFLRVGSLAAGWTLRSIDVAGHDALDHAIDLKEADAIATVKLADRGTELIGTVRDNRMQFAAGAAVIIVPAGMTRDTWSPNRIRETRTSTSGTFTVRGLPPGDYAVLVIDDASAEGWQDDRTMARLMPMASRFSLRDLETLGLVLQMR